MPKALESATVIKTGLTGHGLFGYVAALPPLSERHCQLLIDNEIATEDSLEADIDGCTQLSDSTYMYTPEAAIEYLSAKARVIADVLTSKGLEVIIDTEIAAMSGIGSTPFNPATVINWGARLTDVEG